MRERRDLAHGIRANPGLQLTAASSQGFIVAAHVNPWYASTWLPPQLNPNVRRYKDSIVPEWPFDQPTNCAVLTVRQIAFDHAPILHVTHDPDDHGWQFLTLADANVEDGVVLCFGDIVAMDPSIYELADLPPGWHAWREARDEPWTREPNPWAESDS